MKKGTILRKQMLLYMGILLSTVVIFGSAVSAVYTNDYMEENEQQLILQGERFKDSVASLYYTGAIDMSRMGFELQIMENYMGTSIFFMNNEGKVSLVSDSVNDEWVGKTITDEAVDIVMSGNVATVKGRIGNMFNETVLTVGYPIIIEENVIGGVFMCKSMAVLEEVTNEIHWIIIQCMIPIIIAGALLIYISSKNMSEPLRIMNEAAKRISTGDFGDKIEVSTSDEFGELATSLNLMAENLEKTEKNRRKFISNISHDLRSPLTNVQGFITAIIDGTIPEEKQDKYLNLVLEEAARLTKLANDMTDLSKVEAGVAEIELYEFDINEMIKESLSSFETMFSRKNIKAKALFAEECTFVCADPNMILRVLQNLLDNAIKFTPSNGEIEIEVTLNGNKVYVSVRDNGEGISDEEQMKIFERFFKADSSRGIHKAGVGLGLSIVKEFVKAHGEKIDVFSEKNKGTQFTFSLKRV